MQFISSMQPTYGNVRHMTDELLRRYGFLTRFSIGKSFLGRDISALSVGEADDPVVISAGFHGSEWLTGLVLRRFIENMCRTADDGSCLCGIRIRPALFGRRIVFIPFVNPDGAEIAQCGASGALRCANFVASATKDTRHWQANARGVDINHNFDAGWQRLRKMEAEQGINGPAPTRYGGTAPESEPETCALTDFCRAGNVRHVVALHSQGEVIYWRYGDKMPDRSRKMAEIMAQSSGYALEDPEGLASLGGFKDWFIGEFNRPGFTVELGKGQNPLPMSDLDDIYCRVEEMLTLVCLM